MLVELKGSILSPASLRPITQNSSRLFNLTLVASALVVSSCTCFSLSFNRPRPPERDFALADLFLNSNDLPYGWHPLGEPHATCSASPLGSGCPTYGEYLEFYSQDGNRRASETIYHFLSTDKSAKSFDQVVSDEFASSFLDQSWQEPMEIGLIDSGSSKSHLRCRQHANGLECKVALQHAEFITVFYILAGELTADEVSQVLKSVDQRVSRYLETTH